MRRAYALGLCLALFACHRPAKPPDAKESPDAAAKRVLSTREFPFCEPSKAAMPPWHRDWCGVADRAMTCPQLKEMCARKWKGGMFSSDWDGSAQKTPDEKVGEGDWRDAFSRFHLPELSGLNFIIWALLGIVLALVLAFIVRAILDRKRTVGAVPEDDSDVPQPAALELADPGLGEVRVLLAKARAEADRDVGRALALLYAAALRHLEDKGLIHWETSATNRQYVREIRGRTSLDRPVAELVREVERTKFGHVPPHKTVFETLYSRVTSAIPGAAALVLFILAAGLSSCSCGGGDPGVDGHAAFNEILSTQGIEPTRFAMPLDQVTGKDPPILVDGQDLAVDADMLHALERAMLAGGRILLLVNSKQHFPAWPFLRGKDGKSKDIVPDAAWAKTAGLDPKTKGILPLNREFVLPDTERDPPDVLLERDGQPFALRWKSDSGELVVVADRDLFANASMAIPPNVPLALALARDVVGPRKELAMAELGPTSGAQSPGESLGQAGVLPLTLQVLLALAVFMWARGAAFGALRDRSIQKRRTFSEHVQALGLQFARNRGSRLAASLYAAYAVDRLAARAGREIDRHQHQALAAAVAARTGRSEAEVATLLDSAEAVRRDPNGLPVPERDLGLIRQLRELLTMMRAQ